LRTPTDLTGVAPAGYRFGYDFISGKQYYVDPTGNWQPAPTSSPATVAPLPNNNGTTPSGAVGTSVLYAREDHVHPRPVRLTPPATPVLVAGGPGFVIQSQTLLNTLSTSEEVTYILAIMCTQQAGGGWNTIFIPNFVGFQKPKARVLRTYRFSGNLTDLPPAPFVGVEALVNYAEGIYLSKDIRNVATEYYVEIELTYNLN
jgi:hypothetical protein